ncbi:MAG: hypothetical protein LBI79_04820 [Nitrososphaerota archaeon]|jgi:hypothetical protein|nr:hypothetical protein [Nitrososphaerota archaeon]
MQTAKTNTPNKTTLIHIADREGVIYEWYAQAIRTEQTFVIRAVRDRLTPQGTHIYEELSKSAPQGHLKLQFGCGGV